VDGTVPEIHPAAGDHLPIFVTAPGQSDVLFGVMLVFMVAALFGAGLLYLRLHALPEQLAHGSSKFQFQIVGVLALLALFTHNNLFWIAALLLALVKFPDFATPLNSMAGSLDALARRAPPGGAAAPDGPVVPLAEAEHPVREARG
jgi:multisubunit Na+/H+ antiporter MnhF subunit